MQDQDPLLQREVTGYQQGQQQEPDLPQPPGHRHREGILPGVVEQAVHHDHHGGQRQGGKHGAQQQPAGEAELVLGHLADTGSYVVAVVDEVASQFQPAPDQPQQGEPGQGEGQGAVLGDCLGDLQPVDRIEDQRQGGRHAEQHGGAQGAHVRHPEEVAGAELADLVDLAVLAAVEQLEAGLFLDQGVGGIVEPGQQLPSRLEQVVEHGALGPVQGDAILAQQLVADLLRILQGVLLGLVLVLRHARLDDGGLQSLQREVSRQVGELAAQVLAVGVADLQPFQLLAHRVDQVVEPGEGAVYGALLVLHPFNLIFQGAELQGEGLVLLLLLLQQGEIRGELAAQAFTLGQRLLGLVTAQLVLLGEQAGLPLVLVGDGEAELLQLQLAEIVALLGGELLQLQHLDPVGEALLLEAGRQLLGLLQPVRLVAEAQAIEQGAGLQQLLAQLVDPLVILLPRALQLVQAVGHRLALLAQVDLAVAAQADGLAQCLLFQGGEGRAGLGLVVVQRLLEAGGLLGVVDEDLLVGLALLPVALGVAGILQRLLIALSQLLVFRAFRLGHALQQLLDLGDGIIGLGGGEGEQAETEHQTEQALQHGARFRS